MQTDTKNVTNWQDEEALSRYSLIAPVLDSEIDPAKRSRLRSEIAKKSGISERSLYRYEASYRKSGFQGLKPAAGERKISSKLPSNFRELVDQAIELKKEIPSRSATQIIFILEQEQRVAPGVLKRSTLNRYLCRAGFSVRQMKMYQEARDTSSKRFCKPHRMMMLQADIKYGLRLPIGKNGAKVQTYLSSVIDDHSRYVIHSKFYSDQSGAVVEDAFHKTLLKAGLFDKAYLDNGSQYIAKQLKFSLSKLGITVRHAPVRSGKSKGLIEKFHQVVDDFLAEAKAKKIKTLEEMNHHWENYLEEYYHKKPHDGIREYYESLGVDVPAEGISPLQEWNRDARALKFPDISVVAEAFLHHEKRHVDNAGCISFQGKKYETKVSLIGCEVMVAFDPMDVSEITVSYPGIPSFPVRPLVIPSQCDPNPALPKCMEKVEPTTSRMLDVLEKKRQESMQAMANAISFEKFRKDGEGHV